jgi:hypothetical protein
LVAIAVDGKTERVAVPVAVTNQTRAHWRAWPMMKEVTARIMPTIQQS